MNLVDDLRTSAEKDDVLTVLRKAKTVASKLNATDLDQWLKCELEGYPSGISGDDLPSYRKVEGTLVYNAPNGVPTGIPGYIKRGIEDFPGNYTVERFILDSAKEVVATIKQSVGSKKIFIPLIESEATQFIRDQINPLYADSVSFLLRLNQTQYFAIEDGIKDVVHNWALTLDRKGIRGENTTFSDLEKKAAHTITFNNCKFGTTGDNITITGNNNAFSMNPGEGQIAQVTGDNNTTTVNKPESGLDKIWKWIKGRFGF